VRATPANSSSFRLERTKKQQRDRCLATNGIRHRRADRCSDYDEKPQQEAWRRRLAEVGVATEDHADRNEEEDGEGADGDEVREGLEVDDDGDDADARRRRRRRSERRARALTYAALRS
jgi:hypothetical protein